jgi:hypothetical protein
MKFTFKITPWLLTILFVGCNTKHMDKAMEQKSEFIFPKGDKITNNNFTGTAWLQMLVSNDSIYNASIGNVTFEPGARTRWHKHPKGTNTPCYRRKGFLPGKREACPGIAQRRHC